MQPATIPSFDTDAQPSEQIVMRAKTIVERCDRTIGRVTWPQTVAANSEESIWRESEEQRLHYWYAPEGLDEDVSVCRPPTDEKSRIAAVTTAHRFVLTRCRRALGVVIARKLIRAVAMTDIQAATQAQPEDACVAGETESAEVQIEGLLLSSSVRLEHHRSLRASGSRGQRHDDGGAYH